MPDDLRHMLEIFAGVFATLVIAFRFYNRARDVRDGKKPCAICNSRHHHLGPPQHLPIAKVVKR